MLQVTCSACGTVQQITEPPAKTIACTSCKARIVVAPKGTDADLPVPKRTPAAGVPVRPPLPDLPTPVKPSSDALLADLPAPKTAVPRTSTSARTDLADLPAPKLPTPPVRTSTIPTITSAI